MNSLIAMSLALCAVTLFSEVVRAERTISPGERIFVSGDYVSCEATSQPWPSPPPPPMPPPRHPVRVVVGINYSCLNAIPTTDGKDIARKASRCDSSNPERSALIGDCNVTDVQVDHGLADSVIRRANTVIYDHQKDTVRDAASQKTYLCLR